MFPQYRFPSSRVYIKWVGDLKLHNYMQAINDFAEWNHTTITDIQDKTSAVVITLEKKIYKINQELLTVDGIKPHIISTIADNELLDKEFHIRPDSWPLMPLITRLSSVTHINSIRLAITKGNLKNVLIWFVDEEKNVPNWPSWLLVNNLNKVPCGTLQPLIVDFTKEYSGTYHQLNTLLDTAEGIIVISDWKPRLPLDVDDRRWMYAEWDYNQGIAERREFDPERVRYRKSARK